MALKACPTCGGVLELLPGTLVGVLMAPAFYVRGRVENYIELQPRTVVACTDCEYAEVKR
jgi:hypothetical protein